ncbi:MAG TPA: LPS export ABC transporter periplasmic protein LptC [Longimicrobiales bacterium]|nr:LPS export ABC transporter periplasmic protein LptC [Longimicrobiales bacterium]
MRNRRLGPASRCRFSGAAPRGDAHARVAAALACALLAACEQATQAPVASEFMQGIDAPVVIGMVSYMTSDGVREGRVEADTAYTHTDSSVVDLRGMTVTFYDENGRERATVTGRTGEWNQATDLMVARGDVVLLVHTDSSRIESAEIHYDPAADRIWSDSATVRTLADGTVIRGSSFEADVDFENVRVVDIRGGAQRVF